MGVFTPRQTLHINTEIDAVKRMCDRLEKRDLSETDITEYLKSSKCREEKSRKEFLRKLIGVEDGEKVTFSEFYLNEKLGGIADMVVNQKILFNGVNICNIRADIYSTILIVC